MKRIVASCLLVGFVLLTAGAARAAQWQMGIKGGLAVENLGGDDVEGDNLESRTGFAGGGFAQADFTRNLGLRLEALYFMKGATADSAGLEVGFELDYLEFPVLVVANIPVSETARITFFGGPTLGISVDADLSAAYQGVSGSVDIQDYIAGFEFGLTFGAGASFDVGQVVLGFDGRYGFGLTTVDDGISDTGDADIKNEGYAVMASLGFPLSN
jgi:hypothetical protein